MRSKAFMIVLCLITPVLFGGCADMTDTQKGASVGAAAGAVGGQILGRSTSATLIGAGVGALGGALLNDAMNKQPEK